MDSPSTIDWTSIEHLSKIYRKSIEHLSNIYRSIGHLSKIYRTSIEDISNIYRTYIEQANIYRTSIRHLIGAGRRAGLVERNSGNVEKPLLFKTCLKESREARCPQEHEWRSCPPSWMLVWRLGRLGGFGTWFRSSTRRLEASSRGGLV